MCRKSKWKFVVLAPSDFCTHLEGREARLYPEKHLYIFNRKPAYCALQNLFSLLLLAYLIQTFRKKGRLKFELFLVFFFCGSPFVHILSEFYSFLLGNETKNQIYDKMLLDGRSLNTQRVPNGVGVIWLYIVLNAFWLLNYSGYWTENIVLDYSFESFFFFETKPIITIDRRHTKNRVFHPKVALHFSRD